MEQALGGGVGEALTGGQGRSSEALCGLKSRDWQNGFKKHMLQPYTVFKRHYR